jgi:hypothetical protein
MGELRFILLGEEIFGKLVTEEDVRILVETATLAGAVIGSGKRFSLRRVAIEENIPD